MIQYMVMGNTPNDARLLTAQIANEICELICQRELEVGGKIPNEFELALMFNVGRGTVREAIKLLISRNVLEIRRGTGTFVCDNPGKIDDPFGFSYTQNQTQLIADLIIVRAILEPEIAALAARFATDAEIAEMKTIHTEMLTQAEHGEDFIGNDIALHAIIARSSRNMVMPDLLPIISYGIDLYNHALEPYEILQAVKSHEAIIAAIEAHNSEAAKQAMQNHLRYNQANIERMRSEELGTKK